MFKKLKDKIAEEVKSSPSRIQQLAQVAQAAVSSASSTTSESVPSNDNFFSITEEDTPQNSPHHSKSNTNPSSGKSTTTLLASSSISNFHNQQAQHYTPNNNGTISTTRVRRLSNSSMASDVSFRLPAFDSSAAPSAYHLQSDLDASASEFEDSASTMGYGAQLDVISKEKLYDAYKRSLERYQKYRGRYTELVRRYRDLERDNNKARSVLVETQDKALRRISELREQCSLEQQAKAHLESALRMEMDEQQCIIKTLKTKLSLLGENPDEIVRNGNDNLISLIDTSSLNAAIDNGSGNLISMSDSADETIDDKENQIVAGASIIINDSNEKIKNIESQLSACKQHIADEKRKYNDLSRQFENSQKQIDELIAREEENTILLAQNKLAIHSELENKEKEMKSLKNDAKQSASEKECLNEIVTELRELNSKANASVKELTEAKRLLEEKVDEMNKGAVSAENDNKELRAKVIVLESEKQSILTKNQLELEKFKARYDSMQRKNEQLEEITRTKVIETHEKLEAELKHLKLAHAEISKQLNAEQMKNQEFNCKYHGAVNEHREAIKRLTSDFDAVKADKMKLEGRFKQLFEEKQNLLVELETLKSQLNAENTTVVDLNNQLLMLTQENDNAKDSIAKLEQKISHQDAKKEKNDSSADIAGLKSKIDSLKNEKRDLEKTLEKEIRDKAELKTQVTNILQEIGRLEEQLTEVKQSHSELEREKLILEEKTAKINEKTGEYTDQKEHTQTLMGKIKEYDMKLKYTESENAQLAEKNCLLEENINRMQITLKDFELSLKKELHLNQELKDCNAALALELESTKEERDRLQEKLKKSLDDYAVLFNTKEQMDQEYRSLLDQIEAKEKEKLCLASANEILEQNVATLRTLCDQLEMEKSHLTQACDQLRLDVDAIRNENEILQTTKVELQQQVDNITNDLNQIAMDKMRLQTDSENLQMQLRDLHTKTAEMEALTNQSNSDKENMKESLQKLSTLEDSLEGYDQVKIENEYLKKSVKLLESDLKAKQEESKLLQQELADLQAKLKSQQCELYVLAEEQRERMDVFEKKNQEIEQLKAICERSQAFTEELQSEIQQHTQQLSAIKLLNNELQSGKDSVDSKHKKLQKEFENLQHSLDQHLAELQLKSDLFHASQNEIIAIRSELNDKIRSFAEVEQRLIDSQKELDSSRAIINDLNTDLNDQSEKFDESERRISELLTQINEIERKSKQKTDVETNSIDIDTEELKRSNENLKYELAEIKRTNQREINELNHEISELMENAKAYREKQLELEQLRATNKLLTQEIFQLKDQQQQITVKESQNNECNAPRHDKNTVINDLEQLKLEKEELESKLNKILSEVHDVSNRNLFLEQQCENYMILEQSNERLKLQNSKLSRQLDETLVSMQHPDDISANTEFEYLKNIMFQYLTNNVNSNGITLIKVIAAVLKFTPQQTQVVLEREAHRKTLVRFLYSPNSSTKPC